MQEKTPDQIQQEGNKYVVFSETMKLARPMKIWNFSKAVSMP